MQPSQECHAFESSAIEAEGATSGPLPRRRQSAERRSRRTRWADALRSPGRRTDARRDAERDGLYVDRYRVGDAILLLAIVLINVADAYFTLDWVGRGGIEGNPLMSWLLGHGPFVFVAAKCAIVGVWLLFLTIHKNFRLARLGMKGLLLLYTALLVYHVFLFVLAEPIPVVPL